MFKTLPDSFIGKVGFVGFHVAKEIGKIFKETWFPSPIYSSPKPRAPKPPSLRQEVRTIRKMMQKQQAKS